MNLPSAPLTPCSPFFTAHLSMAPRNPPFGPRPLPNWNGLLGAFLTGSCSLDPLVDEHGVLSTRKGEAQRHAVTILFRSYLVRNAFRKVACSVLVIPCEAYPCPPAYFLAPTIQHNSRVAQRHLFAPYVDCERLYLVHQLGMSQASFSLEAVRVSEPPHPVKLLSNRAVKAVQFTGNCIRV